MSQAPRREQPAPDLEPAPPVEEDLEEIPSPDLEPWEGGLRAHSWSKLALTSRAGPWHPGRRRYRLTGTSKESWEGVTPGEAPPGARDVPYYARHYLPHVILPAAPFIVLLSLGVIACGTYTFLLHLVRLAGRASRQALRACPQRKGQARITGRFYRKPEPGGSLRGTFGG